MRDMSYSLGLTLLLFLGFHCNSFNVQKDGQIAIVTLQETGELLDSVAVYVNHDFIGFSDFSGMLSLNDVKSIQRSSHISASKSGFELASWLLVDGQLQIQLRKATIRHLRGKLVSEQGRLVNGATIHLNAQRAFTATTNDQGEFSMEIPINYQGFSKKGFTVKGYLISSVRTEFDGDSTNVFVELLIKPVSTFSKMVFLRFQNSNGEPLYNLPVFIKKRYSNTGDNGNILVQDDISCKNLNVPRYEITVIDSAEWPRQILFTVRPKQVELLENKLAQNAAESSMIDTQEYMAHVDTSFLFSRRTERIEKAIDQGLDSARHFFKDQKNELNKQSDYIISLSDSVSHLDRISHLDHEHLLTQLEELNKSIDQSSEAFENTRNTSKELVLKLRAVLEHKDRKIQNIQEEKDALSQLNKENLKMFSLILLVLILLLLMSYWVIRRFKMQKLVIEKTKEELLEAQSMANIANMSYDFKKKSFSYSDNFFDTLVIFDPKRKKALRGNREEFIPNELVHKDDRPRVLVNWKKMLTTKTPMHLRFKGYTDDDQSLFVDMNSKIIQSPTGKKESISVTLQNVTTLAENEVKLVKTLEELQRASQAKEFFLASMSHEIRTPLNAIVGLTNHLLSQKYLESQHENLNAINFSSQHLLSLVNDMLDFSRIRAGKLKLENSSFNLKEHAEGIMKSLSGKAQEKGITLLSEIDEAMPELICGDRLRVSQVLINLIGNGIKFTESGSVTLKIFLDRQEFDVAQLHFEVSDSGIGINQERIEKIFDDFEQEDVSTVRKYGGSGLGLTISKELVSLMGGQLKVESEKDHGSRFYFTLQFGLCSDNSEKPVSPEESKDMVFKKLEGVRVLCVEDNHINQLVLSQYFKKWKLVYEFANDGNEALSMFDPNRYDLVFMDIRLPDMDGYEVTSQILMRFTECKVPIIALTAETSEDSERKFEEVGMSGFLPKPFEEKQLLSILQNLNSRIN